MLNASVERLFDKKQEDLVSFFAMGGVHGLPYTAWDNAVGQTTQKAGYCTHGSNIFPTWHRAYVALFEVMFAFFTLLGYTHRSFSSDP